MPMLAKSNRSIGRLVVGARCEAGILDILAAMCKALKYGTITSETVRATVDLGDGLMAT